MKNRQNRLTASVKEIQQFKNFLWGVKVIQSHSLSFSVNQDTKKNRMNSKKGMKNPQNLFQCS